MDRVAVVAVVAADVAPANNQHKKQEGTETLSSVETRVRSVVLESTGMILAPVLIGFAGMTEHSSQRTLVFSLFLGSRQFERICEHVLIIIAKEMF